MIRSDLLNKRGTRLVTVKKDEEEINIHQTFFLSLLLLGDENH
jgi:hypothetical protein